jgi:phosphate transport system substrate-binding protein
LSLLSGILLLLIVVAVYVLTASSTGQDVRPLSQQRTISLAATPDLAPILEVVGARFAESHEGSRVKIDTLSAAAGLSELARGRIHVVAAAQALRDGSNELTAVSLVRDGVTVVVHQSNAIEELSDADVADIFSGRIRNWKFVGGEDAPVDVVKAAAGRVESEALFDYLKLDNVPRRVEAAQGDSEKTLHEIAANPSAVGIAFVATGLRLAQRGVPVKLLRINGVAPTIGNVEQGVFPVVLPVNLISKTHGNEFAQQFVTFAQSDAVRELFAARQFAGVSR